jgi:hypothetical protein
MPPRALKYSCFRHNLGWYIGCFAWLRGCQPQALCPHCTDSETTRRSSVEREGRRFGLPREPLQQNNIPADIDLFCFCLHEILECIPLIEKNVVGGQRRERLDHFDGAKTIQSFQRTDRLGGHVVWAVVQLLGVVVLYARLRQQQNQQEVLGMKNVLGLSLVAPYR